MNYRRGVGLQIILFLILAVCTVLVYLPERTGTGSMGNESDKGILREPASLVDLPVYEISAAAVINEKARFGLIHRDGNIMLEPFPEGLNPSDEELQAFLYRLSKLQAVGTLEKHNSPKEYGLETPSARITLITADGEKIRFSLGRQNPADGTYYLLRDGEETVFLLSEADAGLFITVPSDFESLRLLPRIELKDLDSVEGLSLDFPGDDLPSYTLENRGNLLFRLTAPIENSVSYERVLSDLIFPVLNLSVSERVSSEEAAGAAEKEAEMVLTAGIGGEIYRLQFYPGDLVRKEGESDFFRLEEGFPLFRNLHYRDLLEGMAYHINVSEIESMTLHDAAVNKDYNISLSGEATELNSRVNGVALDYSETMELFEILFRISIARELEAPLTENEAGAGTFDIVIHKKNGSLDRLQFVSHDGELLLFVDGKANFSSYNKTILDIRDLLSRITVKEGE